MADLPPVITSETREPGCEEAALVVRQIAHELRQPLSTIESIGFYLEMILPPADRKARDQVAKLQRLVEEANWIISDAEHFFQACPLRPQLLDLHEVLCKCAAEPGWRENPRVSFALADSLPLVKMDPGQAEHMVRNLLAFSRQSTAGERAVTVHTEVAGGAVRLEVGVRAGSCGGGMADEAARAVPRPEPGLAMATVRRIAEAHGGRFESQPVDDSGFSVRLTFEAAE